MPKTRSNSNNNNNKKATTKKTATEPQLERSALRLDGLEVYAVVGALQAGTSVAMMQEVGIAVAETVANSTSSAEQVPVDYVQNVISICFLLCGTAAALGGIYATIIFALCSLYGKTALGMDRDHMYTYFMNKTGPHRFRAFNAFTNSLLLFCIQVILLFAMKVPSLYKIPVTFMMCMVVKYGWDDCNKLMAAATPIFTNVIPKEDQPGGGESDKSDKKKDF